MEYYNYGPNPALRLAEEEKTDIKYLGKCAGLSIILYFVVSNVFSLLFIDDTIKDLYYNNITFQLTCTIFLSVTAILVPFYLVGRKSSKRFNCDILPLNKPYDMKLAGSAIFLGFFICLAANYVTTIIQNLIENMGYTLYTSDFDVPEDVPGRLYYILTIAVVPALCEEVAIRGTVMQPLRRYGDRFAIIISAFVFAILHGTLIQLPFAFLAGLGFGYVACITGSLWPGMIIHCLNNLYACITEFMIADISDTTTLNLVYYITLFALYAISIAGSVVFMFIRNHRSLNKIRTYNETGSKVKAYFINIPMIIAMIIMLIITANTISKG